MDKAVVRKKETEHIIALLDLLGASGIIEGDRSEDYLNLIYDIFDKAESTWPRGKNAPSVLHNVKCVTFSDNVAIALELSSLTDRDEAIRSFIKYLSVFQGAALKNHLYFRGGIAMGKLYMDSKTNFVWGKALVDAHLLEEKVAIYPRIVLSRQFEEFDLTSFSRVRQDVDGMYFVDYIPTIYNLYPEWIEHNKMNISNEYSKREQKSSQERILQKFGWLRHYIEEYEEDTSD